MGFESYTVSLSSRPGAPHTNCQNADNISHLTRELMQCWPEICPDDIEMSELPYPAQPGETFLVYEGLNGVFQIMLSQSQERIKASVRFAYCNPRSVYLPFAAVVAWLIRTQKMQGGTLVSEQNLDLTSAKDVLKILTPSMEANRRLWFRDAETEEEACLRPEEAIERFIISSNTVKSLALAH